MQLTQLAHSISQIARSSPVEPIALEQGEWQGSEQPGGAPAASGIYTAKWRETDGQWVIEAEIFVTLG